MRIKLLIAAAALSALPLMASPAAAWDRGHHDRRTEVFYRDGCRVEREWRSNGRYSENVDCRRGGWHGDSRHNRDWRSRDYRDDGRYVDHDRWREIDSRYVGSWFNDHHRHTVTRYYGRDCHRYRSDWRRPYRLGYAFPHGHRWGPVSHDLYRRLGPPPRGYIYGRYNDDVLLIREATRLVIDAILLSDRHKRW